MNGTYLYEAMGGIGSDLIAEAEYLSLGKSTTRKLMELAACVILCVGFGAAAMALLAGTPVTPALTQPMEEVAKQGYSGWLIPYAAAVGIALAAWLLPVLAYIKKWKKTWSLPVSVLCCTVSLLLQLWALYHLLQWRIDDIIINYVNYMMVFAASTIVFTVATNAVLWLRQRQKWNWKQFDNGVFLLLCLLSGIQYGFLIGRWKSIVAFGGWVELIIVAVAVVLYILYLFTGNGKRVLYGANLVLLTIQVIPLLLSVIIRYFFCTAYHTLCILLGSYVLFSDGKKEK